MTFLPILHVAFFVFVSVFVLLPVRHSVSLEGLGVPLCPLGINTSTRSEVGTLVLLLCSTLWSSLL